MTSPSSVPAAMTAEHVAIVGKMERFVSGNETTIEITRGTDAWRLREIQSLVSALASRNLVVVKREEIEKTMHWLAGASLGLVDSPIPEMFTRWLSAEPEEK